MRILSLNGGGTRGYITAIVLSKIEEEARKPIAEMFDLISGVSTGSIIAGCIGRGLSANMIVNLYKEFAVKIFKNKSYIPWRSWYSSDDLEDTINEFMTYRFNTAKTNIMIHATAINGPNVIQPKFWKSWKEDDTVTTNEIVVASCSAPIYFPPKKIGYDVYIDGGFVANNPSICAIVEALQLKSNLDDIKLINIETGLQKGFDNAHRLNSIIKWIPNISDLIPLAISTGERSVAYQADKLLGPRYIEVKPSINLPMDSLDFYKMEQEADRLWDANKEVIMLSIQHNK